MSMYFKLHIDISTSIGSIGYFYACVWEKYSQLITVLPTVRLLSCQFFNFFVKILLMNKGGAFT